MLDKRIVPVPWGWSTVTVLIFAVAAVGATKTSALEGARLTNSIYGPKITAETLKGRVVFFEYWGIRCPPCRASFPSLVAMQKKYARTGKFTVIASHVQRDEKAAAAFCRQMKVNFPVYHQLHLPKAPCGRGIPSAYIFDHTGKIAAKGHPATLYSRVAAMVRAAPARATGKAAGKTAAATSPMLKDVELNRFKYLKKTLMPGRSIRATMAQLERKAKRNDEAATEAKAVLVSVKAWISTQLEDAEELSKTRPAAAMIKAEMLTKTLRLMPDGKKAEEILKPLKADRNVVLLASIVKSVDALKTRIAERGPSGVTKRTAARLKTRINALLKRKNLSEVVKAEANQLLESLDDLKEADKKVERV